MEYPNFQAVMDKAYEKWDEESSFLEFHKKLNGYDGIAVALGTLNYQVENGGFMQWYGNEYVDKDVISLIQLALTNISLPQNNAVKKMRSIISEIGRLFYDYGILGYHNPYVDSFDAEGEEDLIKSLTWYDNSYDEIKDELLDTLENFFTEKGHTHV